MSAEMPEDNITPTPEAAPEKTYSQAEVERMITERRARDAEQLRLKNEETKQLKARMQELESKMQKGTATTDEMSQLQSAKTTAEHGQQQGYSNEDVQNMVNWEMQKKELGNKLIEAHKKDPEFAKLVKEGNKITEDEAMFTAYLPNGPAVVKHLLKDKKSLDLYRAGLNNYGRDGGVLAMQILNNLSDQLDSNKEAAHPSNYTPAPELADASDEDQAFDEANYISSKY